MPTLNRDGVNIYYDVIGRGPVVILTYGYSATSEMWRGQVETITHSWPARLRVRRLPA